MEKEKLLRYKGLAPIRFLNDFNAGLLTAEEYRLIREVNKNDAWDDLDNYIAKSKSQNAASQEGGLHSKDKKEILSPKPIRQAVLQDDIKIKSNFYVVPNEVIDILAPLQTPAEEVVYRRLFRLSYGWQKNYCRVSIPYLIGSSQIKSVNTIRKALSGLIKKGHIAEYINDNGRVDINNDGTLYIVFLPNEIDGLLGTESKIDRVLNIDSASNNNTTSKIDPSQNMIGSKNDPHEQTLENTTISQGDQKITGSKNNRGSKITPSYFDPQSYQNMIGSKNDPHKQTLENTTISQGDQNLGGSKNDPFLKTHLNTELNTLSLNKIINTFYKGIGQEKISKEKRERAIHDIENLLEQGFDRNDVEFAAKWTIENSKEEPYDFSIIKHTIGQALANKEKAEKKKARELEIEGNKIKKIEENKKFDENRQKIMAYKEKLTSTKKSELREMALERINRIKGMKKELITEILIESSENEIIGELLGMSQSKEDAPQ